MSIGNTGAFHLHRKSNPKRLLRLTSISVQERSMNTRSIFVSLCLFGLLLPDGVNTQRIQLHRVFPDF